MQVLELLIRIGHDSDTALYLQITNAFIHNIQLMSSSEGFEPPCHLQVITYLYRNHTILRSNIANDHLTAVDAQMGSVIAGSIILNRGVPIIVAERGYLGADLTFQKLGAVIHRVPVDGEGMDIDAVEKLWGSKKIRLVYVIPHHHNPTTV